VFSQVHSVLADNKLIAILLAINPHRELACSRISTPTFIIHHDIKRDKPDNKSIYIPLRNVIEITKGKDWGIANT